MISAPYLNFPNEILILFSRIYEVTYILASLSHADNIC